jgi:hypothetical protein
MGVPKNLRRVYTKVTGSEQQIRGQTGKNDAGRPISSPARRACPFLLCVEPAYRGHLEDIATKNVKRFFSLFIRKLFIRKLLTRKIDAQG